MPQRGREALDDISVSNILLEYCPFEMANSILFRLELLSVLVEKDAS